MKKFISFGLTALLLFLCACSSAQSGVSSNALTVLSGAPYTIEDNGEELVPNTGAAAKTETSYTNTQLRFSFDIPSDWNAEDYTIVVNHPDLKQLSPAADSNNRNVLESEIVSSETTYTQIDFVFRNDLLNPLLRIVAMPTKSWTAMGTQKVENKCGLDYLAVRDDTTFCYQLPLACPYAQGSKADVYNSMVMERSDVSASFHLS